MARERIPKPSLHQKAAVKQAASEGRIPVGSVVESPNERFTRHRFEADRLEVKAHTGAISPAEQERLGVLQAKMVDFWAGTVETASHYGHSFAEIGVADQCAAWGGRENQTGGPAEPIQLSPKDSHYGTFTDNKYALIDGDKKVDLELEFEPNDNADATKVGLTQVVKSVFGGTPTAIDPTSEGRATPDGHWVDRLSDRPSPIYGTTDTPESKDSAGELGGYQMSATGQYAVKTDTWTKAVLKDKTTVDGGNNSTCSFESTAVALEGNQKGTYYGSVKWGYEKSGSGQVSLINFDIVSQGTPSKSFLAAAEKWNASKTRGTLAVKTDGVELGWSQLAGASKGIQTLKTGDRITQEKTAHLGNTPYIFGTMTSGDKTNYKGYIKVTDLEDLGDGAPITALPLVAIKTTNQADVPLYKDKAKVEKEKDLPKDTRLRVTAIDDDMSQIEIMDGPDTTKTGWLETALISNE